MCHLRNHCVHRTQVNSNLYGLLLVTWGFLPTQYGIELLLREMCTIQLAGNVGSHCI